VKAGALLLQHDAPSRLVDLAQLVEAAGYEHLWLADERFFREVYASLTLCALHTRRVTLGPCVTDPYSRHPALTAMAVATLDEISGGRAALGLGAGISGFAQLGIVRRRPARAMAEAIEVIRRLLRGETVHLRGEVVHLEGGRLDFAPARPDLPIYVASNGPLGQKVAGTSAVGAIMEGCGTVDEVRALRERIEAAAAAAGRSPGCVELVARLDACIDDDGDAAIADRALGQLEVDALGLDSLDRRYLRCIADNYGGGPVGVDTLAAALSEQRDTLEEVVEPFLLQQGLLQRTPRGRLLTRLAWRHLDLDPPPDLGQGALFEDLGPANDG
jgi:alkanesulfonate monooxygenase SsuD/methylene tetrahydromethanopterin reductase-like flavin-dependent oxidoreductase (luciferase family)